MLWLQTLHHVHAGVVLKMATTAKKSPGFAKHPGYQVHIENSPRQVRVEFAGETIVNSTNAVLVRESHHVPVYYFPREDTRMDLLKRSAQRTFCPFKGQACYWSIETAGGKVEDALWSYEAPFAEVAALQGLVACYWNKMDHWFEEAEEIFVHPRDPYKRVDAINSNREVKVVFDGEVIAHSTNATLVFETGMPTRYYLPASDIRMAQLKPTTTTTCCPYKGRASYWSVSAGARVCDDLVWSYPDPLPEVAKLKDLLCFYNDKVDAIYIDGKAVTSVNDQSSRYLKETLEGPEHIV